ncbi:MAG: exonuclease SbcCD subunit D [Lachnospiraceae bacterium]|nr:exonuclease SbcCD subunit D [Lachnospiraceae bacterium]
MKFFHLSDLHIGLKLMNRDFREDQEYILRQITEMAVRERPDAIVIAGDIYDKAVPSAEAVDVFDHFIGDLTAYLPDTVIMMISGNHDSASRVNCFRRILSRQNLYMVGQPPRFAEEKIEKVTLTDSYGKVNFYLLPFVKPSMVKNVIGTDKNGNNFSYDESVRRLIEREELDKKERNVLVSHQFYFSSADTIERMDSEVRTVGNIDEVSVSVLRAFDYAALGHLHKPMRVGEERFRYCGTPLQYSVSEAGQQKGILMVELGKKTSAAGSLREKAIKSDKHAVCSHTPALDGGQAFNADGMSAKLRVTVLPLAPLREVRVLRGTLEEVLAQPCEDYVTVILTDKTDLEVIDMQERLRLAFPHLLEIRRETVRTADYSMELPTDEELDPYELCCAFLKDADDEEKEILRDVIHKLNWEEIRK